jgi:hypothetical protein
MAVVRKYSDGQRFARLNRVRAMTRLPPLPDDYPEQCRGRRGVDQDDDKDNRERQPHKD